MSMPFGHAIQAADLVTFLCAHFANRSARPELSSPEAAARTAAFGTAKLQRRAYGALPRRLFGRLRCLGDGCAGRGCGTARRSLRERSHCTREDSDWLTSPLLPPVHLVGL